MPNYAAPHLLVIGFDGRALETTRWTAVSEYDAEHLMIVVAISLNLIADLLGNVAAMPAKHGIAATFS